MKFVKPHTYNLVLNSTKLTTLLIVVFSLLLNLNTFAHGSLSIRIAEKSKEIRENPTNAKLYFERGFLYQQHYEYNKAIKDLLKSEKLGNTAPELKYILAETYYLNKKYKHALKLTEQLLITNSSSVQTYQLQAQILFSLNRFVEAEKNYSYVFQHSANLLPEDIIEYTTIVLALDNTNYNEALNIINVGLEKIGENTLTLQLKKLDYLIASNQTNEAINQYNYFILNNERKEFWYFKKANYLIEIQQYNESKIALQQAKVAIAILKPKTQNTLAIKNLQAQINELEKTLTL
jgi:predicted Zn-dependent protease